MHLRASVWNLYCVIFPIILSVFPLKTLLTVAGNHSVICVNTNALGDSNLRSRLWWDTLFCLDSFNGAWPEVFPRVYNAAIMALRRRNTSLYNSHLPQAETCRHPPLHHFPPPPPLPSGCHGGSHHAARTGCRPLGFSRRDHGPARTPTPQRVCLTCVVMTATLKPCSVCACKTRVTCVAMAENLRACSVSS